MLETEHMLTEIAAHFICSITIMTGTKSKVFLLFLLALKQRFGVKQLLPDFGIGTTQKVASMKLTLNTCKNLCFKLFVYRSWKDFVPYEETPSGFGENVNFWLLCTPNGFLFFVKQFTLYSCGFFFNIRLWLIHPSYPFHAYLLPPSLSLSHLVRLCEIVTDLASILNCLVIPYSYIWIASQPHLSQRHPNNDSLSTWLYVDESSPLLYARIVFRGLRSGSFWQYLVLLALAGLKESVRIFLRPRFLLSTNMNRASHQGQANTY